MSGTKQFKNKPTPKELLTPEEVQHRKFRHKCVFKKIVRLVIANHYWLGEGIDLYKGDDVKRRVEQAVRAKKKKQLLSINDKSLLNKPAELRTDKERQYLYKIIGGLKCFKRYPKNVKKKLAALTYFKYYGPGRTIVRQHQEAHALYFIVTGDVVVTQLVWDDLLSSWESVEIGVMHPGDMFGEVSLLHNIPRTATVTTADHCELLALLKEDFKNVLQVSVQKQWDNVQKAMSCFSYFEALDQVALREGCIVAKLKSYEQNETILGDGAGINNFVYFVLDGTCQMIESMQVSVTARIGRKYYTLYDPYVPKVESEQDMDSYFTAYNKYNKDSTISTKKNSEQSETSNVSTAFRRSSNKDDTPSKRRVSMLLNHTKTSTATRDSSDFRIIVQPHLGSIDSTEVAQNQDEHVTARFASVRMSLTPEIMSEPQPPKNLHTVFMQVCELRAGSTFGFGENMRDRRIIAKTGVNCMLLPKIWLMQKNTANMWTRIQHYLERKLPTKKDLFEEFVQTRRWQEYQKLLIEDVVSKANVVNNTSVHDVPYSIRLEESLYFDFDDLQ